MESWYTGTGTPPRHCAATCAQYRRGRLSPITESRSPRANPRAARPSAKSRTCSSYSRHVQDCQIPRSFSRMAGRSPRSRALRWSKRGSVVRSATCPSIGCALGVSEICLDDLGVRTDIVRRSLGDLLPHVEHGHPVRDVHHDPHVVLDQDDGRAPFLVDVEDEAGHVFLLLVVAPSHGLVEEQDLGVEGEGSPELHALLKPVGQGAAGAATEVLDLQEVDDVLDPTPVGNFLPLGHPPVDEG